MRKQLAFMAGRQHINLELSDDLTDKADLIQIMSNSHINDHFQSLAREVSRQEIIIFIVKRLRKCLNFSK